MPCARYLFWGDSYSTYAKYNPAGQDIWYPRSGNGVTDVSHTWWHILCEQHGLQLLTNDSWSGATVCTTVRPQHPVDAAFVRHMEVTLNGEQQPDVIVLFGGTNDAWTNAPLGQLQYDGWTEESDKQVLPAVCRMIAYVKEHNPAARLICAVNCDIREEVMQGQFEACAHYGVVCVMLHGIDKINGHPSHLGMQQIAEQIGKAL